MIALGLLGVGSFAELALAEKAGVMHCARIHSTCRQSNPGHSDSCLGAFLTCSKNNSDMGYNERGEPFKNRSPKKEIVILPPDGRPKDSGGEPDTASADRIPHVGPSSTSKPTGRTVNGRTEMITASGRIWLWSGKTNTVVVGEGNRHGSFTVMQGDPDIHMIVTVDGKRYNVASPAYAEAIAKKQAEAPQPARPPGSVCSGWGCPDPGPRTSTIQQEIGGQKPKSPASTTKFGGGVNAGGNWQPASSPATAAKPRGPAALLNRFGAFGSTKQKVSSETKVAAPAAAAPLSAQRPVAQQVPAYRGLPQSQQYKFQNKQF
jgi:hypothetical protein